MLTAQVAMLLTYRVGRRNRIIRKLVVFCDLTYKRCRSLPVRKFFSKECMEYGTGRIQCLKLILNIQCIKDIGAEFHRKVGTVGVIRSVSLASCGTDIRPAFTVMFGKAVCCGLCRSCFQVKQLTRIFFLIIRKTVTHMCQYFFCEFLCTLIAHVTAKPFCIQSCLVHSDQTNGGKMIIEASQITFGVRIKSLVQEFRDDLSLDVERSCRNIHQTIQSAVKLFRSL